MRAASNNTAANFTTPGPSYPIDTAPACRRPGLTLLSACLLSLVIFATGFASERDAAKQRANSLGTAMQAPPTELPRFDSTSGLGQYLAVAIERSPGLRAAYNNWLADLKQSDHAGALPDPVFSYAYFVENIETRVGPQEQRFGLRQSFPWFGTLGAKKDMAFLQSQASYQGLESARRKLLFDVKAAYFDYYLLGRELAITTQSLELLTFWESVAQSKYRVGLEKHPDLIKTQLELGRLEERVQSLKDQVTPTASRLRALLNLPDSTDLPIPTSLTTPENPVMKDSVLAQIQTNNPDLRALGRLIDRDRAGERLAGKQSWPSFTIGVDYIQTGEAINSGLSESGKDPWMVGASISLPLWFKKNSARREAASARRRATEYRLQAARNRLNAIAEQLLFAYNDARRKTRLYRDGLVPKAEQSLNAGYAAYRAGEADFLSVLDSQRQLLDFQLTVAQQQVRLGTLQARLEMLSGADISTLIQHESKEEE